MNRGSNESIVNQTITRLDQEVRREFESNRRLLSFDEYLALLVEAPESQLRGSASYLADMMDHFGKDEVKSPHRNRASTRFRVFDQPIDGGMPKLVGQEEVQTELYRAFRSFSKQGLNNRLLLLHGPNGSAKSTLIHSLMGGLERYSKLPEGALYTFNWVFPLERGGKAGLGIRPAVASGDGKESFARLPEDEIAARIPSLLKDHPILLIPLERRKGFLEEVLGKDLAEKLWRSLPAHLAHGDLNHRCKQIFEALLTAHKGDLRRVLQHVQVERFYFSRRYRKGVVTIEPQLHVDAHYSQLSIDRKIASLPPSLQGLNFFSMEGDLIDGNRGLIEYSDLLKRPLDSFKYLLILCETGSVNVGAGIAHFDAVLTGSTNEIQLDAFKEFPDFASFKGRIELIRVPYLLEVSKEKEIYELLLPQLSSGKKAAPHTAWTIALWGVMTRLKKPNGVNYPPNVISLVTSLTPLEKVRIYDGDELPARFSPEERRLLRSHLQAMRDEYSNVPYYEGRIGASVRELKSVLIEAAQNPSFPTLSPLSVLTTLEEFVKRVTEYEFLKQDVKDGYHDAAGFIEVVRQEYLGRIDREVRDSVGLYDSRQWEDFLKRYVTQVSLLLSKEKHKNPITGRMEPPDTALIEEFEGIVGAPKDVENLEMFRRNTIGQIGAWSIDHPGTPVPYSKVLPEFWKKLESHYFEGQKAVLSKMRDALAEYGDSNAPGASEPLRLARATIENLKTRYGYCEESAREVITFLMKTRY